MNEDRPYRECVTRGIAWLKENSPSWIERIDLQTLLLTNCYSCVLGQLYGNFWEARREVFNNDEQETIRLGFYVDSKTPGIRRAYDKLTDEWKLQIFALLVPVEAVEPDFTLLGK